MDELFDNLRLLFNYVIIVPLASSMIVDNAHSFQKAEMAAYGRLWDFQNLLDIAHASFSKFIKKEQDFHAAFIGETLIKPLNVFY
jgi:hypothetical protein